MTTRLLIVSTLAALVVLAAGCCDRDSCATCDAGDGGRDAPGPAGDIGDIGFVDAFPALDIGGLCGGHRKLRASGDPIIDVFVKGEQVIVVHDHAVVVLGPYGRELYRRDHANLLQTAAFDGAILAVSDKSEVTYSGPTLQPVSTAWLKSPCLHTVFVSNGRLVCGQDLYNKREYATLDLKSGTELASGTASTSEGRWHAMRRVPGSDDFISLSGDEPALYRVDPTTSEVALVCNPGFYQTKVYELYAFDKDGVHLVNRLGEKLKITGVACDQYFAKNGTLASLVGGEMFAALDDNGGQGQIVGLVSTDPYQCKGVCTAKRIDVDKDSVLAKREVTIKDKVIVRLRYDPFCGGLVVAYEDTAGFHRVDRIGLE